MPAVSLIGKVGEVRTSSAVTSFTLTASLAVPVGSLLLVASRGQASTYITSITDSVGNTYSLATQTTSGNTASLYYAIVKTAITTSTVITFNLNATNSSNAQVIVVGFANVDTINPIGTTSSGSASAVVDLSLTSPVPTRLGSMLVSVPTINEGLYPTVTVGSLSTVFFNDTVVAFLRFTYRQNDDRSAYSITYRSGSGVSRNWGYVMAEINRAPSDFFSVF